MKDLLYATTRICISHYLQYNNYKTQDVPSFHSKIRKSAHQLSYRRRNCSLKWQPFRLKHNLFNRIILKNLLSKLAFKLMTNVSIPLCK
jgi:hypothetical protein